MYKGNSWQTYIPHACDALNLSYTDWDCSSDLEDIKLLIQAQRHIFTSSEIAYQQILTQVNLSKWTKNINIHYIHLDFWTYVYSLFYYSFVTFSFRNVFTLSLVKLCVKQYSKHLQLPFTLLPWGPLYPHTVTALTHLFTAFTIRLLL